jgi:hypothetical protein
MNEQDFADLRSTVERHTLLPEFDGVASRGRRRRRRRRVSTVVGSLAAVALFLPGLVYIGFALTTGANRPALVQISVATDGEGQDSSMTSSLTTDASGKTVSVRLLAAGGVDMAHAYGLLDACDAGHCDLQLISLSARSTTYRIGLLRARPTDGIANVRISALDRTDVVISADIGLGPESQTLSLGSIFAAKSTSRTVHALQPLWYGPIEDVVGESTVPSSLPHQPKLASPMLASTNHGWWAVGNDPTSGRLSVAYTNDNGASWRTRPLGLTADATSTPSLATVDGRNVYVLAAAHGHLFLVRSTDGGATWRSPVQQPLTTTLTQFGVMTPADGSVSLWIAGADGSIVFRRSTDHGTTFVTEAGPRAPNSPVVTLPDGYVTLGPHPTMSTDGRTWQTVTMPYVPPS